MFSELTKTQVVLCVGNHDYLKKDSYYRTFRWNENVHMILDRELSSVDLPELDVSVYSFSYHAKEVTEKPYANRYALRRSKTEILMVHGGDEKHVPVKPDEILSLGYDYIALGHIHKPQIVVPDKMAWSGSLEPTDTNDVGEHGYIAGEITDAGVKIEFVPFASRQYIHMAVPVTGEMSGYELKENLKKIIEKKGIQNIYKIILRGFRNPDVQFDLQALDTYGNVIEIIDDTKPSYNYAKIKEQNENNILGNLIRELEDYDENSVEYRAMCEGVRALMDTRRG